MGVDTASGQPKIFLGPIFLQSLFKSLSAFVALLTLLFAQQVYACSASIYKRSVVVNTLPRDIPVEAVVFRVRVEESLFWDERSEIQGLRGVLLDATGGWQKGTTIQVTGRLMSSCDEWVEHWSKDHEADGDMLIGYIIGKQIGFVGDALAIKPMLFHNTRSRLEHGLTEGEWINQSFLERTSDAYRQRLTISRDAVWRDFRVDIKALGQTLDRVNQAIQDEIERRYKEDEEGQQQ